MIPLIFFLYAARKRRLKRELEARNRENPDMTNERTPLMQEHQRHWWQINEVEPSASTKDANKKDMAQHPGEEVESYHAQFCTLVGIPPSDLAALGKTSEIPRKSLYGRALRNRTSQQRTYAFTAALSNTLLLSQVVLGAALTALGASESSHILITLFGAANTIIAGVVAYLKSRGQPMRARMFRDDLERVVDEIENSEIMWRGISRNMHGYGEIPLSEGQVTVRSEVARLTRLYDKTIRTNTINNPDMYQSDLFGGITSGGGGVTKLMRQHNLNLDNLMAASLMGPVPVEAATAGGSATATLQAAIVSDPDQSPATEVTPPTKSDTDVKDVKDDKKDDKDKVDSSSSKVEGTKAVDPKGKEPAK